MSRRAAARTASLEPGTLIAGKYRLDRRLAGGGMGSVWTGWDLRLDTPVAIKFMRADLAADPVARARFEHEAKAAAQIRSPHVVHMYDHGVQQGAPYLVMELLEGEDLAERLRHEPWLRLGEVVRVGAEIGKGLARAHALGIVHRDLKPPNVFLSAPDDGLVKLLDFGIAKTSGVAPVAGESTQTGELVGSPHYMSPEQIRGIELDSRSDLWALGVILYRLLTGQRPFDGKDLGDLAVRICTEPHHAPSTLRPTLGAGIDRFFHRALAKNREQRFGSAAELGAAFASEVQACYAMSAGAEPAPPPAAGTAAQSGALGVALTEPTAATCLGSQATATHQPSAAPAGLVHATLQTRVTPEPTSPRPWQAAHPAELPSGSLSSGFGLEPRAGRARAGPALWIVGAAASLLIGAAVAYLVVGASGQPTSDERPSSAGEVETPSVPPSEPVPPAQPVSDAAAPTPSASSPAQGSGPDASPAAPPRLSTAAKSGATAEIAHAAASEPTPSTAPKATSAPPAAPAPADTRGQLLGY